VDDKGKHTARIGRSGRLMTGTMSWKVTFCGLSQISDVIIRQHNKACSVNGKYTLVDFCWNGLKIRFFTLKTCIDAKSIMIQFVVTVFIRLQAAAYKAIYSSFRAACTRGLLTFFYLFILSKGNDDTHLSLGTFFRPTNSLFAFCSLQHHVHIHHGRNYVQQTAVVVVCKHHYQGCQLNRHTIYLHWKPRRFRTTSLIR